MCANFIPVTGPSLINEGFASGKIDVGGTGDLGAIIGEASGLKTKVVFIQHSRGTLQIAVNNESGIKSLKDLAGKKVGIEFSANTRLILGKIFEDNGIPLRAVTLVNLDTPSRAMALSTKDVDAIVGLNEVISLEQKGLAKIIYTTRGDKPSYGRQSQVSVSAKFEEQHPEIVQRIVNALVKGAAWASDEKNREDLFQTWALSGYTAESFKPDFVGELLRDRFDPTIDSFIISRYEDQKNEAHKLGIIRRNFDTKSWFEPKYVQTAIKQLGLQGYWPERDANGNIKKN
jgi:sulfonate transport system substrate-binding protein